MFYWVKRFFLFWLAFCLIGILDAYSQSPNVPTDHLSYELIQDIEIAEGILNKHIHTSIKPFSRNLIYNIVNDSNHSNKVNSNYITNSINFLKKDNFIWSTNGVNTVLKSGLYKNKSDFWQKADSGDLLFVRRT